MSKRIIAASADASTAAANPAAMTQLDRSRDTAAAQGIYIDLRFDTKKSGFDGGDGGNAGEFVPASGYAGSTLGGLWRLRGFLSYRFNDKAGIYFAVQDAVVATKDKKDQVRLHQAVNLTAA